MSILTTLRAETEEALKVNVECHNVRDAGAAYYERLDGRIHISPGIYSTNHVLPARFKQSIVALVSVNDSV